MIFESAFYELVQDVQCHQIMNICMWKVGRKQLHKHYSGYRSQFMRENADLDLTNNPIIIP